MVSAIPTYSLVRKTLSYRTELFKGFEFASYEIYKSFACTTKGFKAGACSLNMRSVVEMLQFFCQFLSMFRALPKNLSGSAVIIDTVIR